MRYIKKRRRKRDGGNRSFFAITVIVCGLLIYALYASSAGKWIMDNYIQPVFFEDKSVNTDVTEKKQDTENKDNSEQVQQTMSYDGFTMYAMQIGAYSAKENADAAAEDLKKKGGAGYVLHDGTYRVLAFGYGSQGEANTVKEQLKTAASMDSSIYTVTVPRLDFKVTGEQKNLAAVDSAFKSYISAKDKVGELAVKFDKSELTKEQVKTEMDAIKKEMQEKINAIDKLAGSDEKLGQFHSLSKDMIKLFEGLNDSDETVFSANVKNIYVEMVCRYSDYVKAVVAG